MRQRYRFGICAAVTLALTGCGASASAYRAIADSPVISASATMVAANCEPVWVRGNQMIFNRRQANGHWNAYIGNTNCTDAKPLLRPVPGHLGACDVTPDGQYVLLEEDFGNPPGRPSAQPGKGFSNQLVLLDRRTGRVTQLTYRRLGTIWGMLNPAGTMVTWSQMTATPLQSGSVKNYLLGVWQIHLADITPQGTLSHERVWSQGKGFYETYGWYGHQIMFASDARVHPKSFLGSWLSSQDWMIKDTLPARTTAKRISGPLPNARSGTGNDYHEFMTVTPPGTFSGSSPWILTSIVYQSSDGMDMWRMRPDGSGLRRLTYFNGNAAHQQVAGFPSPHYATVLGLAIDPSHPSIIYASVSDDLGSSLINLWRIQVR